MLHLVRLLTPRRIPETDGWFSRLEEMRTVLDRARKEIRKSDVKRLIKVAVLDTGVDMNHSRFKEWRRTGQLDAGLDLISRDQPITDTDGHGTHTCHVLLKTAPNIKLYPIRVFKAREAETSTPSLVAEVCVRTGLKSSFLIIFEGHSTCRSQMGR